MGPGSLTRSLGSEPRDATGGLHSNAKATIIWSGAGFHSRRTVFPPRIRILAPPAALAAAFSGAGGHVKRATELCSQPSESHSGLELGEGRTEAAAQPPLCPKSTSVTTPNAQPPPAPRRGGQRKPHPRLRGVGGRPAGCARVRAAAPAPPRGFLPGQAPTDPPAGRAAPSAELARGPRPDTAIPPASRFTSQRAEEVEEGVVGDLLGDCSHGASALMLLLFLDGFDGHVLPFLPVNGAPTGIRP